MRGEGRGKKYFMPSKRDGAEAVTNGTPFEHVAGIVTAFQASLCIRSESILAMLVAHIWAEAGFIWGCSLTWLGHKLGVFVIGVQILAAP